MPLTQDRMLSLLAEAEAFRDAYDALKEIIYTHVRAARNGESDLKSAIFNLEAEISISVPRPLERRILTERTHFKHVYKRNIKEKERASQRRWRNRLTGHSEPSRQESHIIPDEEIFTQGDTLETVTDLKNIDQPDLMSEEAIRRRCEEYEAEEQRKAGLK